MDNVWDFRARGGLRSAFCCRNNGIKTHACVCKMCVVKVRRVWDGNLWGGRGNHSMVTLESCVCFFCGTCCSKKKKKKKKMESFLVPGSDVHGIKQSCFTKDPLERVSLWCGWLGKIVCLHTCVHQSPVPSDDTCSAVAWAWEQSGGFSSDEGFGTQMVCKYLVKSYFCVCSVCLFSFPFDAVQSYNKEAKTPSCWRMREVCDATGRGRQRGLFYYYYYYSRITIKFDSNSQD